MKLIGSLLFVSAIYICGVFSDVSKAVPLREYYEQHSGDPRIVGGIPAQANQFPWQVRIVGNVSSVMEIMCGGSILNQTKILTAAQCLSFSNVEYKIYLGGLTTGANEVGRVLVTSSNYYTHPDYNSTTLENDVGIIELDAPLTFGDNIQPVGLPQSGQSVNTGAAVRISGWGSTSDNSQVSSSVLNWVNLTTISNSDCEAVYTSAIVRSSTVCALGAINQNICSGDAGGALVVINGNGTATQVGVASFISSAGCSVGLPSGYVRTEAVLDFIINSGNGVFISKLLLAVVVLMKVLLR